MSYVAIAYAGPLQSSDAEIPATRRPRRRRRRARFRTISPVPFVLDVSPAVLSVVVRLAVRALPRAAAATVVANVPAPFAVPASDAIRGRVVVRVGRIDHDRDRPRRHDATGEKQRG